jgi:hypothetical protein
MITVAAVCPIVAGAGPARPNGSAASIGTDPGMGGRVPGILPSFQAQGTGLIRLQVGAFDPLSGRLPAAPGVALVNDALLAPGVNQHWLTQVRDGRFPEVRAAVEAAGAKLVGNIPDTTYMVRATPAQRLLIAASPAVRWMGLFQAAWKVPAAANGYPGLLDLAGRQTYLVFGYRDDPAAADIGAQLAARPGIRVVEDDQNVVAIEATAAEVPAIAALPQVQWVTMPPTAVLQNAQARWVIDTGERDVLAITKFLTGAGQTAAVADTALAYTQNSAGRAHEAFRDCNSQFVCKLADYTQAEPGNTIGELTNVVHNNVGSPHRKMVAYFDLGKTGVDGDDPSTHGTHVAGSVAGDAGVWGQPNGDDGMAPGARLVQQNINGPGGSLQTPGGTILPFDYYQLFRQAYRPSHPASVPLAYNPADYANYNPLEDARTHNNSYGLTIPVADLGQAMIADQFVWDHEDMNIVIAAGNAGPRVATLGAPAVAKNILSSGATSNGRQPMVSFDSNTNFSSHGPTADGRFGVTVSDPGEVVVSTKGGTNDGYQYLQGTSMSSPILTGASTLVRQYFWDGYGPSGGTGVGRGTTHMADRWNPSAALVRATIVNGAVRMRGLYTGTDGTRRELDGQWPSTGQGFGRLNLDNSLYLANDPVNNWYADAWRGSPDAFSVAGTKSYTISVDPGAPLDVTMAYTDAPNLQPAGTPSTVNNLDLVVIGPGGVYSGNNMNSRVQGGVDVAETQVGLVPDPVNTIERVHLENPPAGTYTVQIVGQAIQDGPQGFAVSASGRIHDAASGAFVPGPDRLRDIPGDPKISTVAVEPVSADLAKITFTTNEPTSASATIVNVGGAPHVYNDVYTVDRSGYYGIKSGPVETSDRFAGKPVIGTSHEIYLTGLSPGTNYDVTVRVDDLGHSPPAVNTTSFTAPSGIYQPSGTDMAQLLSDGTGDQWVKGKQLYTGALAAATDAMGVFMFRVPASVDPSKITGAMVEMTTAHNLTDQVKQDPLLSVQLLDDAVKPAWGTQTYQQIDAAPVRGTALPDTPLRNGGGQRLDFTFACSDLAALKLSLATTSGGQRLAAFRTASTLHGTESVVSYEFGYNRRSRGPEFRPKLVLLTGSDQSVPPLSKCDPTTPAPKITDVGIHPGITSGATVTWRTDVESDSLVLFREKGTTSWTQVGSPGRTRLHQVAIRGVDPSKHYEFGVRSTACNGRTTTADNNGAGWDLFRPPPPTRPTTAFYFHGPAGSATFDGTKPSGSGQTQTGNPFTDAPDTPGDPDSMWWQGPLHGSLDGDLTINAYFSSANPLATSAAVDVRVWADADPVAHTGTLIGTVDVANAPAGSSPAPVTITVPVKGAPVNNVLIQLSPHYIDASPLLTIHYDSAATPSGFAVPIGPRPPDPYAGQPKVGPLVPLSAGATNLNLAAVATRNMPTPADLAAGTGRCGGGPAVTTPPPPPNPDDGNGGNGGNQIGSF